jgi:hypothetical protein
VALERGANPDVPFRVFSDFLVIVEASPHRGSLSPKRITQTTLSNRACLTGLGLERCKHYQRGSRNPRPPGPPAFWRRYSAYVASARFSSKTDFCCFAILMASQNEASVKVSSAPMAARNTPRSRCSSENALRCSNLSASASASLIASRASEVRSAIIMLQPLLLDYLRAPASCRLSECLLFPARSTEYLWPGATRARGGHGFSCESRVSVLLTTPPRSSAVYQ